MKSHTKPASLSKGIGPMGRIETQIHRRRKIKVLSPLQIEWDCFHPLRTERSPSDSDIGWEPESDA